MTEHTFSPNEEQQVKKLKRFLEGWRMAVLPLKSVILWEQQWYPGAIICTVSVLYIFIWLMDFNLLTNIAVIGLFINFVDFIVPAISKSLYSSSSWTGQHEKVYEQTCRDIVVNYNKIIKKVCSFYTLRETKPCLFYLISIGMLFSLAWVSLTFNNILLLYFVSMFVVLWPGIHSKGVFNPILSLLHMAPKEIKAE